MNKVQEKLKQHEKTIGTIASILAIVMFFSLIEILISNLNGQSKIFIQPLSTAINGVFWCLYAYGRNDYFRFYTWHYNCCGYFNIKDVLLPF